MTGKVTDGHASGYLKGDVVDGFVTAVGESYAVGVDESVWEDAVRGV